MFYHVVYMHLYSGILERLNVVPLINAGALIKMHKDWIYKDIRWPTKRVFHDSQSLTLMHAQTVHRPPQNRILISIILIESVNIDHSQVLKRKKWLKWFKVIYNTITHYEKWCMGHTHVLIIWKYNMVY